MEPKRLTHSEIFFSEKVRSEIRFAINMVNAHMPILVEKLPNALNQRRIANVTITRVCNQLNNALAISLNQ